MEQIKSIIGSVLQNIQKKRELYPEEGIEEIWLRCVKKNMAKHTKAHFLKRGTLFVNVENPAWIFELNIKKEEIVEKLQSLSKNKIKNIRFRVGDIYGNN